MSDKASRAKNDAAEREAAQQREVEQRFSDVIAAERRGLAKEKAAAERAEAQQASRRAENVEHRRMIDLAAQVKLTHILFEKGVAHDLAASIARSIVFAVATGNIPNMTMKY